MLKFTEPATTTYIRSLLKPQQNQCADKICVTAVCTRNPLKFCMWNPLIFWNMIKDLSLDSRNIQTQNCAPIQCKVWRRKVELGIRFQFFVQNTPLFHSSFVFHCAICSVIFFHHVEILNCSTLRFYNHRI